MEFKTPTLQINREIYNIADRLSVQLALVIFFYRFVCVFFVFSKKSVLISKKLSTLRNFKPANKSNNKIGIHLYMEQKE